MAGGNAVDAAIATGFALAVTHPAAGGWAVEPVPLVPKAEHGAEKRRAGEVFELSYFLFPEIGSAIELLYLDANQLPPPEVVIDAGTSSGD